MEKVKKCNHHFNPVEHFVDKTTFLFVSFNKINEKYKTNIFIFLSISYSNSYSGLTQMGKGWVRHNSFGIQTFLTKKICGSQFLAA